MSSSTVDQIIPAIQCACVRVTPNNIIQATQKAIMSVRVSLKYDLEI